MKKHGIITCLAVLVFNIAGIVQVTNGQIKSRLADANGIKIAYETIGPENGESILLIHGIGTQLIQWPQELCEQLVSKGYRVIRFDNRDVGLSSRLDSLGSPDWNAILPKIGSCDTTHLPYTLNDMARDAVELLNVLKIEKAHIVGASMGGAIAQLIAINYPEKTLSLTSIMASSGNPHTPKGDPKVLSVMGAPPPQTNNIDILTNYLLTISKAMGSPGYLTPDSLLVQLARKSIQRSWYPMGATRQAAAIIVADNCDRREQLRKIKIPVVVIHGEADPVVNIAAAREVAASIPNSKLITIPGMGHDLPDELIPQVTEGILMAAKK